MNFASRLSSCSSAWPASYRRLVPPPRIHRHRYHGVLAPNARLRPTVVSIGRPAADESPTDAEYAEPPPSAGPDSHSVAPPCSVPPGPTPPSDA
jgi:hypothetical protein